MHRYKRILRKVLQNYPCRKYMYLLGEGYKKLSNVGAHGKHKKYNEEMSLPASTYRNNNLELLICKFLQFNCYVHISHVSKKCKSYLFFYIYEKKPTVQRNYTREMFPTRLLTSEDECKWF